jgi:hypothetical protein
MLLDGIKNIDTLWYEDEAGNKLDSNRMSCELPKGWKYQYCASAVVVDSICTHAVRPKWPVRWLRWMADRMPRSWQGNKSQIMRGESTINCIYPIVKHLVEQNGFSFNDACVLGAGLCERCLNIVLWELEGDETAHAQYLNDTMTTCKYCDIIDSRYLNQKRVKACYRALKYKGDIAKAYRDKCFYSGPNPIGQSTKFEKILDWAAKRLHDCYTIWGSIIC